MGKGIHGIAAPGAWRKRWGGGQGAAHVMVMQAGVGAGAGWRRGLDTGGTQRMSAAVRPSGGKMSLQLAVAVRHRGRVCFTQLTCSAWPGYA